MSCQVDTPKNYLSEWNIKAQRLRVLQFTFTLFCQNEISRHNICKVLQFTFTFELHIITSCCCIVLPVKITLYEVSYGVRTGNNDTESIFKLQIRCNKWTRHYWGCDLFAVLLIIPFFSIKIKRLGKTQRQVFHKSLSNEN